MSKSPEDVVRYLEALEEGATIEECEMLRLARSAVLELVDTRANVPRPKARTLLRAAIDPRQEDFRWPSDEDR